MEQLVALRPGTLAGGLEFAGAPGWESAGSDCRPRQRPARHAAGLVLMLAGILWLTGATTAHAQQIQMWEDKGIMHKGIRTEMQAGPLPSGELRGQIVHVIWTRGLSWQGNDKWWVETGYHYVPPGYQGGCQSWKIFYSTNTLTSGGQCCNLNPHEAYYAAVGPANPYDWHRFELIKGPNSEDWSWGVKIDGTVFTWLPFPDTRWSDWMSAGQTEVKRVKEVIDAKFWNKFFYHGVNGQQPEVLRAPFEEGCGGNIVPWPLRPGYRRSYYGPGENIGHDGPTDNASCPK